MGNGRWGLVASSTTGMTYADNLLAEIMPMAARHVLNRMWSQWRRGSNSNLVCEEMAIQRLGPKSKPNEELWLDAARKMAMQATESEIVVDMSAVQAVSSYELGELIRLHLEVKQLGRKLVLENTLDHLREVFTLTRLDRLIELRQRATVAS